MTQDQQTAPVAFTNFDTFQTMTGQEHSEENKARLKAITPGFFLKLAFLVAEGATARMEHVDESQRDHPHFKSGARPVREIMWVEVTKVNDDGTYEGTLNNDPVFIPIDDGHPVAFSNDHVLGLIPPGAVGNKG